MVKESIDSLLATHDQDDFRRRISLQLKLNTLARGFSRSGAEAVKVGAMYLSRLASEEKTDDVMAIEFLRSGAEEVWEADKNPTSYVDLYDYFYDECMPLNGNRHWLHETFSTSVAKCVARAVPDDGRVLLALAIGFIAKRSMDSDERVIRLVDLSKDLLDYGATVEARYLSETLLAKAKDKIRRMPFLKESLDKVIVATNPS